MGNEAEKYKEEDKQAQEKVQAKNELESYAFQLKQSVEDEKVASAISESDKSTLIAKSDEIISWLDNNQTAEKDEFEHKKKELEAVANPIMTKLYQAAGGAPGGMPGGMPGGAPAGDSAAGGPTIEEVD